MQVKNRSKQPNARFNTQANLYLWMFQIYGLYINLSENKFAGLHKGGILINAEIIPQLQFSI
jgi:hypothetical protein